MKKYIILFLLSFALLSCTKEEISPTQAQLTAAHLKKDIGTKSISSITVYALDGKNSIIGGGTSFKITDDGFIVLSSADSDGPTFNLGQLVDYQIFGSPTLTLNLYF